MEKPRPHDDAVISARSGAAAPRRFSASELSPAVNLLCDAFAADPVMDWIFRDGARRRDALSTYFSMALKDQSLPHNECHVAPGFEAIAVWLPPDGVKSLNPGLGQQITMAPRIVRACGWKRIPRALAMMAAMEKNHPKTAPHWYLFFFGVSPAMQGMGLGSAILEATLSRVDATGFAASLDNSNPKNTRLYERHGFRVLNEYRPRADGPPIWTMWRDAKKA
ncbi:MAG TPA: GNAT family N-acetyltransferase [Micropepsaceae bacterium]|nr:GNAT family N-acetyltransferase [Micropepsaceae bacterium]